MVRSQRLRAEWPKRKGLVVKSVKNTLTRTDERGVVEAINSPKPEPKRCKKWLEGLFIGFSSPTRHEGFSSRSERPQQKAQTGRFRSIPSSRRRALNNQPHAPLSRRSAFGDQSQLDSAGSAPHPRNQSHASFPSRLSHVFPRDSLQRRPKQSGLTLEWNCVHAPSDFGNCEKRW